VGTLGFRGEALHAIGAVSRLTVRTRPRADRDADGGTELAVEGGEVTSVDPAGCPEGTTVEVRDLFYNVPARRKYLKQDGTEFAHVNTVVTGYALANPDVQVALEHDGRETFATTGRGDLRETVMSVYGSEVARSMIRVDSDGADGAGEVDLPDGPLEGVAGLVSHPETNRSSREYLATYVNGRYVRSSTAREAVVDAYGAQLAPNRYPFAVLFLDLPGGAVDVNVHPRKREIRFADDEGVREQVRTAIEAALRREGLVRSSAPRGRSAPEQTEIAPGDGGVASAEEGNEGVDATAAADSGSPETSATANASGDAGHETERKRESEAGVGTEPGGANATADTAGAGSEADGTHANGETDGAAADSGGETTGRGPGTPAGSGVGDAGEEQSREAVRPDRDDPHDGGRVRRAGGGEQATLGGDAVGTERAFDRLPSLRVLGQFRETYVVAETDDGLVLIDQHAADERVNYERLRERVAGGASAQALADPVDVEVTAREAALFEEFADALARLGFHAERTGERTVEVRTVPALVAEAAGPELVRDVLSAFVSGDAAAAETVDAAVDTLLADMACYPSVTGNTSLSEGSILDLLSALDDCENPYACPHGRPVIVEIDAGEIGDRFERDYPGHGGRREGPHS
jgi:DNA mismatch repair protein MutL